MEPSPDMWRALTKDRKPEAKFCERDSDGKITGAHFGGMPEGGVEALEGLAGCPIGCLKE
ncbi:MAG: hypothetical protein QXH42_09745 [Thermoplasmata archaeon]